MKRLRNEICDNSPLPKRQFGSSRGESHDQSHVHGLSGAGTSANQIYSDAFSYLKKIEDTFPDNREKYAMFLNIMIEFKARRIDTVDVMIRVRELFKGHPSLLLGLNLFLPRGYEIISNHEHQKKPVNFEEAINFVKKIKERLGNDLYESFLVIFRKYKHEGKDINEACHEIVVLLNGHPDLLNEFSRFMPSPVITGKSLPKWNDAKRLMK